MPTVRGVRCHLTEGSGHLDRAAEPMFRGLLECPSNDVREGRGDVALDLANQPGRLVLVLLEDGQRSCGIKGEFARQHLVQHAAQGVDVRPGVCPFPPGLLGRHVVRGAHHHAGGRHGRQRLAPGNAEIGHFRSSIGRDQHVLGLDVPMHHTTSVGGREAVCDLQSKRGGGSGGKAT